MFAVERRAGAGRGRAAKVVGPTRVEQIMARPVVSLDSSGSAREAARTMLARKISALPILRDDEVLGLVTESNLLRWLDELDFASTSAGRLLARPVSERMPARIISVAPEVPLEDVIDIFRRLHVRHVPVAGRGRMLVGIISDRDVRRALGWSSARDMLAEAEGRLAETAPPATAADIMQTEVATVTAAEPLRIALQRMLERRIHSLPVVEGPKLVGIITMTDFTKLIAREDLL
jgi:CBS domain-containing protein